MLYIYIYNNIEKLINYSHSIVYDYLPMHILRRLGL